MHGGKRRSQTSTHHQHSGHKCRCMQGKTEREFYKREKATREIASKNLSTQILRFLHILKKTSVPLANAKPIAIMCYGRQGFTMSLPRCFDWLLGGYLLFRCCFVNLLGIALSSINISLGQYLLHWSVIISNVSVSICYIHKNLNNTSTLQRLSLAKENLTPEARGNICCNADT